jgi:uncharacterized protein (TIGR00297 family)
MAAGMVPATAALGLSPAPCVLPRSQRGTPACACSLGHARAAAPALRACSGAPGAFGGARASLCAPVAALRSLPRAPRRAHAAAHAALLASPAVAAALSATPGLAVGAAVNSLVFLAGLRVLLRGLTPAGVAHAALLGTLVYAAFGAGGYALVCVYFLAGSAVTKLRLAQKQAEGIAEARSGRRSPASVWGSGAAGMAAAAAALAGVPPGDALWRLAFVASFASKLADTASSEVGKAYGRTTYLCTTFRRVPRGTEGAVSAEGTAAGVVASAAMATLALALGQVRPALHRRSCCVRARAHAA